MNNIYVVINDMLMSNPYSVIFIDNTPKKVILRKGDSEIDLDGVSRFILWGTNFIIGDFEALQGDIFISEGSNKAWVEKVDSGLILTTNFESFSFTSERDMKKIEKYGFKKIGNMHYGEYKKYFVNEL